MIAPKGAKKAFDFLIILLIILFLFLAVVMIYKIK